MAEQTIQELQRARIHNPDDERTKFIRQTLATLTGTGPERHVAIDEAMKASGYAQDRLTGHELSVLSLA